MKQRDKFTIEDLLEVMARLRDPVRGCPWDREQDFGSIAPYTIEEAYEVADAIDRDDLGALCAELGDLLLQVVFHAQMARELGAFEFGDVVQSICEKMIRRHPHVFGGEQIATADAQREAWEGHKARERTAQGDGSVLDDIGLALPALLRAEKLGRRAARVGFDWPDPAGVLAKLHEELDELQAARSAGYRDAVAAELGDVLFTVANLARHLQLDPEEALRGANRKFETRFRRMEAGLQNAGERWSDLDAEAREARWQAAKTD